MAPPEVQRPVPHDRGPGRTAPGRHPAPGLRTATAMVLVSGTGGIPVHAELRYRCEDPFAVQMVLSIPGSQVVTWTVGRDLLTTGLAQPSGLGDVHLYPTRGCVVIELRTREPTARLVADRHALADFLTAAASLVPPGTETDQYNLDEELHRELHSIRHG